LQTGLQKDPSNNDIKTKLQEVKSEVAKQKKFYGPDGALLTGASALKAEGNDNFKNGKYDEAISCYTAALSANPPPSTEEMSVLYSNRAACYSQFQNWHAMEADCTRCLEIDPKNAKALIRRGLAYEGMEKYKLALADMKSVLEVEPTSMQASQSISRLTRFVNALY
jgi:stress-induced-phosphoprotein 1